VAAIYEREPERALALREEISICPLDLRDFAWRWYYTQCQRQLSKSTAPFKSSLLQHTQHVTCIAFSLDGKILASGAGWPGGRPAEVNLWDAETGKRRLSLEGLASGVHAVGFSPDATTLLTGTHDGLVRRWDVATGRELAALQVGTHRVAFSPD